MPFFPLRLHSLNKHIASLEYQYIPFFSPHLHKTNKLVGIKCASLLTPYINIQENRGVVFIVDFGLRHGLIQKKLIVSRQPIFLNLNNLIP